MRFTSRAPRLAPPVRPATPALPAARALPLVLVLPLVLALLLAAPPGAAAAAPERPDTTWVLTFDRDFYNWADPHVQDFDFPPAGGRWSQILLYYRIECPAAPGDCDPWDRLGHLRVVVPDSLGGETHYEIARIITPYDITGGNYPGHCEWVLDVSDYESLLHDRVTLRNYIESWIGGQRGWLVTIRFAFIRGFAPLEPYRVMNLYQQDHIVYGDPGNPHEAHLPPLLIPLDADAVRVKARAITTGHGQGNTDNAAEFARKWHAILAGDDTYSHELWRGDCVQNDCSPQGGTWWYARAGWCPGDKVDPWDVDITPSITPGTLVEIDYDIQPYENFCRPNNPNCVSGATCPDCNYNYQGHTEPHFTLQSQLILYRERSTAYVDGDPGAARAGATLELEPNQPNPGAPATEFRYALEAPGAATITIWTADGRVVRRLAREHGTAGSFSWVWDGRDERGAPLPAGTYFYEVRADGRQGARRMVLLR